MHDVDSILTSIFGLKQFRLQQREIVNDVLAGRDALVVMPTGAGKSLCYQLPAVALRGLTLIVSPLISLMTDQVRQMRALRIPAMMLCSGQSRDEQREVMARLRDGFRGLLYVAPERFSAPGFFSIITGASCRCWRSTRRTASASGDTISVPSICAWARFASNWAIR